MSGELGRRQQAVRPGLSANLHGARRVLRPHAIEDARSASQHLDASLVLPDRSLFEVAIKRSLGNWAFFVPAAIAVLWLSTVIADLALVTSALLSILIVAALLPSAVTVGLAAPQLVLRLLTRHGRRGYGWFCAATLMAALDCGVYATCLFLLARASGFARMLPI